MPEREITFAENSVMRLGEANNVFLAESKPPLQDCESLNLFEGEQKIAPDHCYLTPDNVSQIFVFCKDHFEGSFVKKGQTFVEYIGFVLSDKAGITVEPGLYRVNYDETTEVASPHSLFEL
jgi:hypothetical protein